MLTPAELAARWKCSEKTLAQHRWRGTGPRYLKLPGAGIRYPLAAVEAVEASSTPQPAA